MNKLLLIFTLVFASSALAKVDADDRTEAANVEELECITGYCGDKVMREKTSVRSRHETDIVIGSILNEGQTPVELNKVNAVK